MPPRGGIYQNIWGCMLLGHKNSYPVQAQEILILQPCSSLNAEKDTPVQAK